MLSNVNKDKVNCTFLHIERKNKQWLAEQMCLMCQVHLHINGESIGQSATQYNKKKNVKSSRPAAK